MRTVNGICAACSPLASRPADGTGVDAVAERRRSQAERGLAIGGGRLVLRAGGRRIPDRGRCAAGQPDGAGARLAVAEPERRADVAAMPRPVEQAAAVDPDERGRRGVLHRHDHPHERHVVVPRVGDEPGDRGMRVERDADLAEPAGERDDVVGQCRRLLLVDDGRRRIPGDAVGAHLHPRVELRMAHARPIRQRAADDLRARRRRPLPPALRPHGLARARLGEDAVRRDVGTARGGAASAEDVARFDVAAPAGQIAGEVVGQRVLAGVCAGAAQASESQSYER